MLVILKKYRVFLFLSLILGLIIFLKLVFQAPGPKPVPSPLPSFFLPAPEAPTSLDYALEGKLPELPPKAFVYKVVTPPTISLDEARVLAASFNLSGEPKTAVDIKKGNFYTWTTEDTSLVIGGQPPIISFGLNSLLSLPTASAVSSKTAAEMAKKILEDKGLAKPSLDLANPEFTYFQVLNGNLNQVSNSSSGAQIIRVSFAYQLDGLPLLGGTPGSPAVALFFGPNGQLLRLIYTKYPEGLEELKEVNLFSQEQALERLKNQQGTIVHLLAAEDVNAQIPPSYRLSAAKIKKAYLALYYIEEVIQPVFVFEAEAPDQSGKIVSLIIYLPASSP